MRKKTRKNLRPEFVERKAQAFLDRKFPAWKGNLFAENAVGKFRRGAPGVTWHVDIRSVSVDRIVGEMGLHPDGKVFYCTKKESLSYSISEAFHIEQGVK